MVTKKTAHKWDFKPRFRRHAFGWKSQPAIARIKEAVAEIHKVAKADPILGAEGAVLFLERLSPAIEQVDSSSGSIGSAVNRAIDELVPLIVDAPADAAMRDAWLERLWDAYQDDGIPYIELLGDKWGELCGSKDVASAWADRLIGIVRKAWSPDPSLRGFFQGSTNCLSCLLFAGRYDEILQLLSLSDRLIWDYRQYGVMALARQVDVDAALRYAEQHAGRNDSPVATARVLEDLLLTAGRVDEAYERFALTAHQSGTYLAWFRAVTKKYPHKAPREVLLNLVDVTPGMDGKWFAAAKDAGMFDLALELAGRAPCDPKTLTRAARDFASKRPQFAIEAGLLALRWLVEGYGYEITSVDVAGAYAHTMSAAAQIGKAAEVKARIREVVAREASGERFVTKVLGRELLL